MFVGFRRPNLVPIVGVLAALILAFLTAAPTPTTDFLFRDLGPPAQEVCYSNEGMHPTVIGIDASGTRPLVDTELVDYEELGETALKHAIDNNPVLRSSEIYADAWIVLYPDQSVPYGVVIDYLSRLHEQGFVRVGLLNTKRTRETLCESWRSGSASNDTRWSTEPPLGPNSVQRAQRVGQAMANSTSRLWWAVLERPRDAEADPAAAPGGRPS